MILVDSRKGSVELIPHIKKLGVPVEAAQLMYADAAFEGNGKKGKVIIGVERKTLHDILNCIDDSRYGAHQRPGMARMYGVSILALEGGWKPHTLSGTLLELFRGVAWGDCRYRSQRVMYAKLFRYMLSIGLSGVIITQSWDLEHTAYNIVECYHYFQKRWEDHTSLLEVQKFAIPDMGGKPSLVRRWATQLEDIGVKYSLEAERLFKTPIKLAQSEESDWLTIKGIGIGTAQKVIREIRGWRR